MTRATAEPPQQFWSLRDPVIDEHGQVVEGGMFPHQREWWSLPNFIRGLVTGYGGGKTWSLGKRMISLALVNAPVPVITVSPTYPMALSTIVETIDELLTGRQTLEQGRLQYHLYKSQPYRFVIRYGGRRATILCASGEHPDRLKGSNLAAAGIDEPFMQERAVLEQIVARVRHPRAKRREINLTGTPEGVVGWGYDLFEGDLRAKYDVGLVQCSSRMNLALPPDYVDRLASAYDDTARAAYVEGRFVNMAQGRVYHAFDATTCVRQIDVPDNAEWGIGMDFNVNPMAFCIFWRHGERLHFVAEYEKPNSSSDDVGAWLRDNYPNVRRVYPDATGVRRSTSSKGKSDFDALKEHGLQIVARSINPPQRDRFNAVNGGFRHGRVTISPECRKLRTYLMAYTHDGAHRDSHKKMSHLLDAMGYPIAYLMPVTKTHTRASFVGA